MNLIIQIESIAISFLFGILFSLLYNLFYHFLYTKFIVINIITNLFFSLIMFGMFFLFLYNINGGVIHLYFLFSLFLAFYLYCKVFVKLRIKWFKRG